MASPSLTGLDGASFLENTVNGAPQIIDGDVTVTDADDDFDGGTLVVSGLLAEDTVSVASGSVISLVAGTVWYDADGVGGAAALAIGSAAGGVGATFIVTFNANATSAGIEALVERLTYANASDTPTADRQISINITDAAGNDLTGDTVFQAVETFPLAISQEASHMGTFSRPTAADIDQDGDLDVFIGGYAGEIYLFENTGTAAAPVFTERFGAANPLDGVHGYFESPALADLDNDGDLDAIVGSASIAGYRYFENTGTAQAAVFAERFGAQSPVAGLVTNYFSTVAFGDLDHDGDLDFVGGDFANVRYFMNTGTNASPAFVEQTGAANPLNGAATSLFNVVALGDIDNDGDLDFFLGAIDGNFRFFLNTGTVASPVFVEQTGASNPLNGMLNAAMHDPNGAYSSPALVDVDNDGDLDILSSFSNRPNLLLLENTTTHAPLITVHVAAQGETIAGSGANDTLTGTAEGELMQGGGGNDTLNGGGGDDSLDGGSGSDRMSGGDGDDTYTTDGLDTLTEAGNGGIDTVRAAINFTLGANFENLVLSGHDNLRGTGNGLNNAITGNDGDNTLRGLAGDDTLDGGGGRDWLDGGVGGDTLRGGADDDTYIVDNIGDTVVEYDGLNGGNDTVRTDLASYTLADNVENLIGTRRGAQTLIGNDLDNVITSGRGFDQMTGGGGADAFVFLAPAATDSRRPIAIGAVMDFNPGEGDRIDLSAIDANRGRAGDQGFHFVGAFTRHASEAVMAYDPATNASTLSLDTNGDGRADFQFILEGGDFRNETDGWML